MTISADVFSGISLVQSGLPAGELVRAWFVYTPADGSNGQNTGANPRKVPASGLLSQDERFADLCGSLAGDLDGKPGTVRAWFYRDGDTYKEPIDGFTVEVEYPPVA